MKDSKEGDCQPIALRRAPAWLVWFASVSWRLIVIGALVYAVAAAMAQVSLIVLPFVLSLIFAATLHPAEAWLRRRRWPPWVSTTALVLLLLALFVGALAVFGFGVREQIPYIIEALRNAWDDLLRLVRDSPLNLTRGQVSRYLDQATAELRSSSNKIATEVLSSAATAVQIGSQILLILVLTFFLLKDGNRLFAGFVRLFPEKHHCQLENMGHSAVNTLGGYIRGISLVALINSVLKGIALLIIGVPMVVPIMVLTFVGSFIPFAGPVIAGTVASLIALAHGGIIDALWVIAASIGIQALEGNVLQPFIVGKVMDLHPVIVLLSVATGAILAGLAGAFLALPLLAVVVGIISRVNEEYRFESKAEVSSGDADA